MDGIVVRGLGSGHTDVEDVILPGLADVVAAGVHGADLVLLGPDDHASGLDSGLCLGGTEEPGKGSEF